MSLLDKIAWDRREIRTEELDTRVWGMAQLVDYVFNMCESLILIPRTNQTNKLTNNNKQQKPTKTAMGAHSKSKAEY